MYADDVAIFNSGSKIEDVLSNLTHDMKLIANWSNFNRLSINYAKSKYMVFGSRSCLRKVTIPQSLRIGNNTMFLVKEFTYLGLKLDFELTFIPAFNDVIRRVNQKIYSLSIIRKDISKECAILIYKTMILPFFDYINYSLCLCSNKHLTKLQRFQNRALRICLCSTRYDRISDLHANARVSTLDLRRQVDILKIMHHKVYQNVNSRISFPYNFVIIQNNDLAMSVTRARSGPIVYTDQPRSGRARRSFLFQGVSLWNSLSPDIRNISDPLAFKVAIKRLLYI